MQDAHVGAVTFIQRSDSACRLNVHAHSLFLDGVYVRAPSGALAFHALGAPTFAEEEPVAQWTHARIVKVLLAHGRTLDGPGNGAPSSVTITATSGGSSVLPPTSGGQTVNQTGGSTVLANEPAGGFSSP